MPATTIAAMLVVSQATAIVAQASTPPPPGPGPFGSTRLPQPVVGSVLRPCRFSRDFDVVGRRRAALRGGGRLAPRQALRRLPLRRFVRRRPDAGAPGGRRRLRRPRGGRHGPRALRHGADDGLRVPAVEPHAARRAQRDAPRVDGPRRLRARLHAARGRHDRGLRRAAQRRALRETQGPARRLGRLRRVGDARERLRRGRRRRRRRRRVLVRPRGLAGAVHAPRPPLDPGPHGARPPHHAAGLLDDPPDVLRRRARHGQHGYHRGRRGLRGQEHGRLRPGQLLERLRRRQRLRDRCAAAGAGTTKTRAAA